MFGRSRVTRFAITVGTALALASVSMPADATPADRPGLATGNGTQAQLAPKELEHGVEQSVLGERKRKFVFDASVPHYSVVAVRAGGSYPLIKLFADPDYETLLAESDEDRFHADFVVIDSRHVPVPTTYYPMVKSRHGDSMIELDSDAGILEVGEPLDMLMLGPDVVTANDVYLEEGVDYRISVKGDGNPTLSLMLGGGTPGTSFMGVADAVAHEGNRGPGEAERIEVTGTGDWYAVIVFNQSSRGDGIYRLKAQVFG
jgi:hypothetical protein